MKMSTDGIVGGPSPIKCTLGAGLIFVATVFFMFDGTDQFGFQPRLITRFCYNSPNMSSVNVSLVDYVYHRNNI